MILQKSIQEVIESAKVEDVVGDFVSLRNRGVNMLGLCPFHNEKTPSFTVSPQKNIYKCFGCGEAGNPISFVMAHEGLSFPEAIRYLAKKYGIELEETGNREEHQKERQLIDSLYIVNEFALKYYQNQLVNTDLGKSIGLSYFKERGFREDTIEKFGLGYAPGAGDFFTKAARKKKYNTDFLKKVGLSNQYGKDFFRGRVMFPIKNLSGKVIGFGGRILGNNKKTAKYMNTPETEIYNKSKVLYGIYYAKKSIRQNDECILVEGYTDVISLNQSGIENVVASSGTSLTIGQIQLIKRYTPNIKILYDGDAAGIKAATRGLDLVLEQGLNVKVVQLPTGEDPDSYIQSVGTTKFKEYLEESAQDFILFKTNLILKETANDPIKKATLIKDIVGSIARIPDPIKRSVYIRECSNLMDIREQVLINETNKIVHGLISKDKINRNAPSANAPIGKKRPKQSFDEPPFPGFEGAPFDQPPFPGEEHGGGAATFPEQKTQPTLNDEFQEKDMVRLLLEVGHEELDGGQTVAQTVLADMSDLLTSFDNKLYGKFVNLYHHILSVQETHPTQQQFLHHEDAEIQKLSINILAFPYEYSKNWVERYEKPLESRVVLKVFYKKDMLEAMNRFKLKKVIGLNKQNQERLKDIPKGNYEEMMRILKVQKKLLELKKKLGTLMNTVVLQ
jgi:DNA primase